MDTPRWLVQACQSLMHRDPVKAVNEAEILLKLLEERADKLLKMGEKI